MRKRSTYTSKQNWRKFKLLNLLLGLALLLGMEGRAQFAYFTNTTARDFFTDTEIEHIHESSRGFLWLGTDQGVYRFDGLEYKKYTLAADSLAGSTRVSHLFESADQKMWIAFEDGQIFHPTYDGSLVPWAGNGRLSLATSITGLAETDNTLWIATYGQGLFIYRPDSILQLSSQDGLLGDDIYDLSVDSSGTAYLATDRGINIVDLTDGRPRIRSYTPADGMPGFVVRTLLPDPDGGIWAGTFDNGVFHWDPTDNTVEVPIENWDYGIVNSLELFRGRELWIGTERKGLIQYQLRDQSHHVYTEINDLGVGRILDLHKDREANLWVLSNALSIVKTNRKFEFLPKEEPDMEDVQAILADHRDQLWIGTQEGIYQVDPGAADIRYRRQVRRLDANILSLYQDAYHNIWIGTFGEGVYIFEPRTRQLRQLTPEDGLVDGSVLSIDGREDEIYVGTLAGVTRFTIGPDFLERESIPYQQYSAEDRLNAAFIYKVFVDSKGRIWLGTDSEGINQIDGDQLNYYTGSGQTSFNSVYSITEDRLGNIWFTTLREGIFRYDGQTFQRFGVEQGLRNLNITSLITDQQGNVLILHPSGIDIMDPETGQIIYYDEEVGVSSLEPNLNVVCRDRNGDIWIGGRRQILKYQGTEENFRITPQTSLDQVEVSGETIEFAAQHSFPYNQNTFVFRFKGLWYTDPEAVQYRYQLSGLDEDWIYTRDQEVNYVNLRPGKYTLRVGSTANNTFSQEPAISYTFTVRRPFWETAWFVFTTLLLTGFLVWYGLRLRERRVMRESRLKKEKIESQFEALKSQINPHFLFNSFNTLVAIIEENPGQAVDYVERLADFYRSILQYREKTVIPLAEELSVVRNYYYLLRERFGQNLNLHIDVREEEAYVPPLSIQMLVENAIKHNVVSARSPLQIRILQNGKGRISVTNNLQPKRIRPRSTAFGLSSIVARYGLLSDKKVGISQNKKEFKVTLPLIQSEFASEETPESIGPDETRPEGQD